MIFYGVIIVSLVDVELLVNSTLGSFAAIMRTDTDKTVVVSTTDTMAEILKPLKALSFPVKEEVVSSLITSIQDVLDNKVKGLCRSCSVTYDYH